MANIITAPESGIYFDGNTAGVADIPTLTGNASGVAIQYDGYAGIEINSSATGVDYLDRFSVEGANGRLFGVSDAVTGTVFSVNDAAGLPIIEVESTADHDKITIGEYGTNALVVSGDKVGIGIDDPSAPLDIESSQNVVAEFRSTDNRGAIIVADDDTSIFLVAEGSKASLGLNSSLNAGNLNITSSGEVGIGTTSPAEKLTVIGDILIDNGGNSTLYLGKGAEGVDGVTKIKAVQTGTDTDQLGIAFNVHPNTAGSAVSEEAMRIDHDGNVGIGITNPAEKLEVTGGKVKINKQDEALIINAISNNGSYILLTNTTTPYAYIGAANQIVTAGTATQLGIRSQSDILFATNGLPERMRIDGAGNVGIGTTSPTQHQSANETVLHIADSNVASLNLDSTATNGDCYVLSSTGSGDFRIFNDDTNTTVLNIDDAGNVGIGTDSPSYRLSVDDNSVTNIPKTLLQFDASSIADNGGYNIDFRTSSNDLANRYVARIRGIRESSGALSQLSFWTESGSALEQRMTIRASGNVGIGTTNPNARLDVKTAVAPFVGLKVSDYGTNPNALYAGVVADTSMFFGSGYYYNSNQYRTLGTAAAITRYEAGNFKVFTDASLTANTNYIPTERMRINSSGNVGIGTTSAETKLHVASGDVLISNNQFYAAESTLGTNYKLAGLTNGNVIQVGAIDYTSASTVFAGGSNVSITTGGASGTSRLYINSSGEVGIGTTSPAAKLHAYNSAGGDATDKAGMLSEAVMKLQPHASNSTNMLFAQVNSGNGMGIQVTNGPATANWDIALNPFGGNVGIGTTSPDAALHVAGAIPIAPTGSGVLMGLQSNYGIVHLNGSTGGILEFSSSGVDRKGRILYDNAGNYMQIQTNGSDKVRIDSSGNVGIGTTGPSSILNINGGTGSLSTGLTFGDGDTGIWESSDDVLRFSTASTTRAIIDSSGNVDIGSVFAFDISTDCLTITNNQNTGGINLSGGNSRIYFGGYRAIEGDQSGGTLYIGEGYGATSLMDDVTVSGNLTVNGTISGQLTKKISGDGAATTFTVTHSFGTPHVMTQLLHYGNNGTGATYEVVQASVKRNSDNAIDVVFGVAPTSSEDYLALITKMPAIS